MTRRAGRRAATARIGHRETGQIALLTLGFAVVTIALILGTVAVTSVQLSRLRLLDAADGAALDAASSLDSRVYHQGLGGAVGISSATVRRTAGQYLAERSRPPSVLGWHLAPGTGSPDGQTAVVRVSGEADLPFVGGLLSSLGGSVTITVESRARAPLR